MYNYFPKTKTSTVVSKGLWTTIFVGAGGFVGLGCYIKNTFLLKTYGRLIELRGNDGPVKPSLKLEDLVVEVTEDLKNVISEHTPIHPRLIPGLNTVHLGTVGTFQGGIVGLPYFFEFNNKEEVEGKIQWDDTLGKDTEDILSAFVLSNEAKKYGIAREILLVNSLQVYFDGVLPFIIPYLVDIIVTNVKVKAEVNKFPPTSRAFFFTLLTALALLFWRYLHLKFKKYNEKKAEVEISKLGEAYIRGAIEYNTKAIQRSQHSSSFKDQKNRILKAISDKLKIISTNEFLPSQKVGFYKSLIKSDN